MVSITLTKTIMRVSGFPDLALSLLDGEFARPDPKAYVLKAKFRGLRDWDGMKRFYETVPRAMEFRRGFYPRFVEFLSKHDLDYEVIDTLGEYQRPDFLNWIETDGFKFDPIQVAAGKAMISSRISAIELAVSSGKTEITMNAACCYLASRPNSRALVVVPSRNLMRQTYQRIAERLPSVLPLVGMFGDGERPKVGNRIVISTIASSVKYASKALKKTDCLIIDEAHRSKTESVKKLIDTVEWDVLWACSGKLTYLDDDISSMSIEAILGRPVFRGAVKSRHSPVVVVVHKFGEPKKSDIKLHSSVRNGVECLYKINGVSEFGVYRSADGNGDVDPDLCDEFGRPIKSLYGIWKADLSEKVNPEPDSESTVYFTYSDIGVMMDSERNAWAISKMLGFARAKEPFVATVARLRHAKILHKKGLKAGLKIGIVSGESSGEKQAAEIAKLATGELDGIVAVYSTMSEGVDVPKLVHMLKLDGIASEQVLTQQLGRVKRKHESKECGYLHIPTDDHYRYLAQKSAYMVGYYERCNETIERQ